MTFMNWWYVSTIVDSCYHMFLLSPVPTNVLVFIEPLTQHLVTSGPVKTYSYKRLQVLEARFHLHKLLNSDRELAAQKSVPHR